MKTKIIISTITNIQSWSKIKRIQNNSKYKNRRKNFPSSLRKARKFLQNAQQMHCASWLPLQAKMQILQKTAFSWQADEVSRKKRRRNHPQKKQQPNNQDLLQQGGEKAVCCIQFSNKFSLHRQDFLANFPPVTLVTKRIFIAPDFRFLLILFSRAINCFRRVKAPKKARKTSIDIELSKTASWESSKITIETVLCRNDQIWQAVSDEGKTLPERARVCWEMAENFLYFLAK